MEFEKGQSVVFTGFTGSEGDMPDNGEMLEKGNEYEVLEVVEETVDEKGETNEGYYTLSVPNPKFDSEKRKSKKNKEFIGIEVYSDEVEVSDEKPEEVTEDEKEETSDEVEENENPDLQLLDFADIEVGNEISVITVTGDTTSGTVVTKRKASLDIDAGGEKPLKFMVKNLKTIFAEQADEVEEETDDTEKEEAVESIEFDKVSKGDSVTVIDSDGVVVTGKVVKKLKSSMSVDDGHEDGPMQFKKADIESIVYAEAIIENEEPEENEEVDEEEVEEEKPKKTAKKKAAKKSKLKEKEVKPESEVDKNKILILKEDEEDEDIAALIADSDNVCDLALEIAEDTANSEYKLGGILFHIYTSEAYKEVSKDYAGKKGFELFVETELNMAYRKAMHLLSIYSTWCKYSLPHEDLTAMGRTKASMIARYMNKDNAKDLVELAKTSTVNDLKDNITETYTEEATQTTIVKKTTFKFRLDESDGDAVKKYFEMASDQLQMDDLNQVFSYMVSEWAVEHLNVD